MTEKSSNRRETTKRRKSSAPLTSEETELIKHMRSNAEFAEMVKIYIFEDKIKQDK